MLENKKYIYGVQYFDTFKVGSMVSWKPINKEKQYGIILETFITGIENDENRSVAYAKVLSASGGTLDLMLAHIKLESEVRKCLPNQEKSDT